MDVGVAAHAAVQCRDDACDRAQSPRPVAASDGVGACAVQQLPAARASGQLDVCGADGARRDGAAMDVCECGSVGAARAAGRASATTATNGTTFAAAAAAGDARRAGSTGGGLARGVADGGLVVAWGGGSRSVAGAVEARTRQVAAMGGDRRERAHGEGRRGWLGLVLMARVRRYGTRVGGWALRRARGCAL